MRYNWYTYFKLFIAILLFSQCRSVSENKIIPPTINIKSLGAKGDGVTNDANAFLEAIKIINSRGGGTLILPSGTYRVVSRGEGYNEQFKFANCFGVTIRGENCKIDLDGNIHRETTRINQNGIKYSNVNQICPFYFKNCKDVILENIEVDGNADMATRDTLVVEAPNHLVVIEDCINIKLRNLDLHHALADGIYVGNSTSSRNLNIDSIKVHNNARQGISIIALQGAVISNSDFSYTGVTDGTYGGHNPMAGIDVEPNFAYQKVSDIAFKNCLFSHNLGSQIVVSSVSNTEGVIFENCKIVSKNNCSIYPVIVNAKDISFQVCEFQLDGGSIYPTWHEDGTSCLIENCIIESNRSGILAVTQNNNSYLKVNKCKLKYTGREMLDTYFPYVRMVNCDFINNEIIIHPNKRRKDGYSSLLQKIKNKEGNIVPNKNN